jgi:hypothetical protein
MTIIYTLATIGVLFIAVCAYACCVVGGACDDETDIYREEDL